jgi:tetratricopeptide (TPR) repeat protein
VVHDAEAEAFGDQPPSVAADRQGVEVVEEVDPPFDYLLDAIQRATPAGEHVPEATITTALRYANATEATNLATTAQYEGRYRLAETAFRQALSADQAQHGADHPSTLASRNNLATVFQDLGRLEEAESEHRAVLEARRRVLGANHPETLRSRNNLATVLRALERQE